VSKAAAGRHAKKCAPDHDAPGGTPERVFALRVEGAYAPDYWLDVEIKAKARLEDLDTFLRAIWLECCGHLSAFRIGPISYSVAPDRSWGDERSMNARMSDVIRTPSAKFTYEYDFGSTTELKLRVVGERTGIIGRKPLRLLARNEPLVWPCRICKQPATQVCIYCIYGEEPFFCDEHADEHQCDEEPFLPVVNSPRMGVCAYTGS
jgi:hypothetical protein